MAHFEDVGLHATIQSRKNHFECKQLYEMVRKVYKDQKGMDLEKNSIIDTFLKGFGTDIYESYVRHRDKNNGLSRKQILKRNKRKSQEDIQLSIRDEIVYNQYLLLAKERYLHLRKYAFHYHFMTDVVYVQSFLDIFLDEFLSEYSTI